MAYYKLVQFTLLIRINRQLHEFNFLLRRPGFYETDTVDPSGNRHYFKMVGQDSKWKIEGTNLPSWIMQNEEAIGNALNEKDPVSLIKSSPSEAN